MSQTAGVKALDRFGTATSVKAVRTISVTKYRSSSGVAPVHSNGNFQYQIHARSPNGREIIRFLEKINKKYISSEEKFSETSQSECTDFAYITY